MPWREKPTERVYWPIEKVGVIVNRATSCLRHWEDQLSFLNPKLNKVGHRRYDREDLRLVKQINFLRLRSVSLKGIQSFWDHGLYEKVLRDFRCPYVDEKR